MNIYQKIFVSVSVILTIGSLFYVPWSQIRVYFTPLPQTVQEQVDDVTERGLDGIIVYVDKKGQPAKHYVSGWKNRVTKTPADPQSLFKIASVTKLYVAAVVAKLADRQDLPLERSLAEYLPSLNGQIENADQITLAMLVQHRSGIPNYSDAPSYPWFEPNSDNADVIKIISGQPADFKPNAKYSYSNTNYYLIGEILKQTLGHDYEFFIKQEILQPLGLTHTYTSMDEVNMDELMSGYMKDNEDDLKAINYTGPMGSMLATAQDVGIFLRALNDGTLFTESEQAIYSSIYTYNHTGLLPGYSTIASYHKDIDTVVIQFVNTSGTRMWGIMEVTYDRIEQILRN
ncbi:MAG: beta-lactamase family protein [Hyphomicrobiales bacterium]